MVSLVSLSQAAPLAAMRGRIPSVDREDEGRWVSLFLSNDKSGEVILLRSMSPISLCWGDLDILN